MNDLKQALGGLLQQLSGALRSAGLYPPGHPAVHTPLQRAAHDLAMLLRERDRVILGIIDDVLVLDEIPFYEADTKYRAIYDALLAHNLESVTFHPEVALGDLATLVALLTADAETASESILDAAKHAELQHVTLRDLADEDDVRTRARKTYERTLGIVIDLATEIRLGKIPTSEHAMTVIDTMRDIVLADQSALLGLTQLKSYDDYTYNHSVNVAIFSLAFARYRGVEGDALRRAGLAGLLHDIGKVRTAEAIIKKPGALTDEEMRAMQLHPELGVEIMGHMTGVESETSEIVLHHHLRYDGEGYPKLPPGREPHPHGEIVAVADCYDALTTTRPYQKSRHPSEAVRILRRLGGKAYDPATTSAFIDMIGAFPVGEVVRLSTNELAVVVSVSDLDATAPLVRIVTDSSGGRIPLPTDCDLAAERQGGRVIAGPVDPLRKGIDVAEVLGL